MSKIPSKKNISRAALPKGTVVQKPQPLDGIAALAAADHVAADLLVNSDIWTPAHAFQEFLFQDARQATYEHIRMTNHVCRTLGESNALEATEWAHWGRILHAAYIIGIAVGRRATSGGAR